MRWNVSIITALILIGSTSGVVAQNSSGSPKKGQAIYERLCLRCHGEKLDGKGEEAKFLTVRPADLNSLSSRIRSDWELLVIISNGVMFTPMHGFRDVLNEAETRDVMSYIRMIAPFKPIA